MKPTNSKLSEWLETESGNVDGLQDTDHALGSHTLNELADLVECFELLERVWPTEPAERTDLTGKTIGPYTLVREIGRGGMGTVWEAEQATPIRRHVALKLIQAGQNAARVAHRFEAERHLLAKMDHPNIARILDAGTTTLGQPWFAMELVEGTDVLTHCRLASPSIEERLQLFLDVCHAIEHAHQKGVIHRDLKPSNVLVHLASETPTVKVIDFGLARAENRDLEITAQTRTGAILGSLTHMSPEQTVSDADADTRTDVFLLGGLLYQLLTGENLLPREVLESGDVAKILIAIREQQPLRPSQRITSNEAVYFSEKASVIERRLRKELDWIVMRAIEKEPDRRYQSVAALSTDIRRFLANEPVIAKPPSSWYSAKKYVQRHTAFVLAVSSIIIAIVLAAVTSSIGFIQVTRANRLAQDRLNQIRQSNEIILGIFSDLDLDSEIASRVPLRIQLAKRLIEASQQLTPESEGDPLEGIRLQFQLGQSLNSLGFYREAVPVCRVAYENARDLAQSPTRSTETFLQPSLIREAGHQLALAQMHSGEFAASEELLGDLLAETDSSSEAGLETRHLLATLFYRDGRWNEAQRIASEVCRGRKTLLGASDLLTLESEALLARIHTANRNARLAVPILERCVAEYRNRSPNHPRTIQAIGDLAHAYGRTEDRSKAEALADEAYQLALNTYGESHEVTLNAKVQIGLTAWTLEKVDAAERLLSDAISGLQSTRSRGSRSLTVASQILARLYRRNHASEWALPMMEQNLDVLRGQFPSGHPALLSMLNEVADLRGRLRDFGGARSLIEEVLRDGDDQTEWSDARRLLGRSYFDEGRFEKALETFRESRQIFETELGRFSFENMLAIADEAKTLSAMGQHAPAIGLLESYLSELETAPGRTGLHRRITTAQLGIVLARGNEPGRGIELMEFILDQMPPLKEQSYLEKELRLAYFRSGKINPLRDSVDRDLRFEKHSFDANSIFQAFHRLHLGRELIEFGEFERAIATLQQSIAVFETRQDNAWQTANARLLFGRAKLELARNDEESIEILDALEAAFVAAENSTEFASHQYELDRIAGEIHALLVERDLARDPWQRRTQ
ncbi:MAG: serine/threonine-protein kinase [Planctomycetota bacterium]